MRAPIHLLARDGLLLVLTLALWQLDASLRGRDGAAAVAVAVLAGGLATLVGYLVHEWGHLVGAWASRSVAHLPETAASVFLFQFDADRNDRRQFLWMSCGGFAASAFVVALYLATLPMDALSGQVALGLTALGVLATAILELPPAWRVLRGAPIPRGVAYRSSEGAAGTAP